MNSSLELRAVLQPRGPAGAIVLSDEQVAHLGAGKSPAVRVTVNGRSAAARIARMGGEHLLGMSKKLRADLGVEIEQTLGVVISLDTDPREAELPAELSSALAADSVAKAAFEKLAPSHRKEYARWIGEAKGAETKQSRLEQA